MIRRLLNLLLIAVVVIFLLLLFRPDFIANAGNALISASGDSTATGSAQFIPDLQGKGSSLQLNLQGLTSHLHYVVTLNQGSCGGKVLATLGTMSADENGNANTIVTRSDLKADLQQGVWVNVHQGDASGPSIACGQVQINNAVAAQYISITPTLTANQTPAVTYFLTPTTVAGNNGLFSGNDGSQGIRPTGAANNVSGFPETGVAPAKGNSYDNYKYPRKY